MDKQDALDNLLRAISECERSGIRIGVSRMWRSRADVGIFMQGVILNENNQLKLEETNEQLQLVRETPET